MGVNADILFRREEGVKGSERGKCVVNDVVRSLAALPPGRCLQGVI